MPRGEGRTGGPAACPRTGSPCPAPGQRARPRAAPAGTALGGKGLRGAGTNPGRGSEKPSSPRDSRRGQRSCGQRRARPATLPLASGRGLGLLRAAEPTGALPLPGASREESWRGRSDETFSCSGSADSSALIQIYRYSTFFFFSLSFPQESANFPTLFVSA